MILKPSFWNEAMLGPGPVRLIGLIGGLKADYEG
jgi:hypothetical protein